MYIHVHKYTNKHSLKMKPLLLLSVTEKSEELNAKFHFSNSLNFKALLTHILANLIKCFKNV